MNRYATRVLILLIVLAAFWLALSGFFKPLLLTLGVVSCLLVAWITLRKSLVDEESILTQIHWSRWCRYQIWLVGQITQASLDVAARIVNPTLPISPTVDRVPAQLSDLGKVIYANSITLTPGTVSINLTEDAIVVHSLTRAGIDQLKEGEMYRRIRDLEKKRGEDPVEAH